MKRRWKIMLFLSGRVRRIFGCWIGYDGDWRKRISGSFHRTCIALIVRSYLELRGFIFTGVCKQHEYPAALHQGKLQVDLLLSPASNYIENRNAWVTMFYLCGKPCKQFFLNLSIPCIFILPRSAHFLTYIVIVSLLLHVSVHMHHSQGFILAIYIWKRIAVHVTITSSKLLDWFKVKALFPRTPRLTLRTMHFTDTVYSLHTFRMILKINNRK